MVTFYLSRTLFLLSYSVVRKSHGLLGRFKNNQKVLPRSATLTPTLFCLLKGLKKYAGLVRDFKSSNPEDTGQLWTGAVCISSVVYYLLVFVSIVWTQLRWIGGYVSCILKQTKPGRSPRCPELVKCMTIYPCLTAFLLPFSERVR